MSLKETLLMERKVLLKKDILSDADQTLLEQIDSKLMDMEFPVEIEGSKDKKTVLWNKEDITLLYTLGKKPSEDMVAVNNCSKPILVNVKLNLRESASARTTFERKLKGLITPDEFNEIYKKINSVVSVVSVYDCDKTDNFIITYRLADDTSLITTVHPMLDFSPEHMYVGLTLPAIEENNLVNRYFLMEDFKVLTIPELPREGIQPTKDPITYMCYYNIPTPHGNTTSSTLTTLKSCFEAVKDKIDMYIDLSDSRQTTLLSLWTVGTTLHKLFNCYPYVSLLGMKGSGKTKLMSVCSYMSFYGTASVGISPPALFRGTDLISWSMFLDESELFKKNSKSKRAEELLPLILSGYKRGAMVPRVGSKESGFKLEFFGVYCPKMFASTEEMNWILESRCIQIIMRPPIKGGKGEIEPDEFDPCWKDIRTDILTSCINEWKYIKQIYLTMNNNTTLGNRDYEIAKPILALAKYIGEDVYNEIKSYLEDTAKAKIDDFSERDEFLILKGIVLNDKWDEQISIKAILSKILEIRGSTADWMNSKWVGNNLKKFDLKIKKVRKGHGYEYIFNKENVFNACLRFGVNPEEIKLEVPPESVPTEEEGQICDICGKKAKVVEEMKDRYLAGQVMIKVCLDCKGDTEE